VIPCPLLLGLRGAGVLLRLSLLLPFADRGFCSARPLILGSKAVAVVDFVAGFPFLCRRTRRGFPKVILDSFGSGL